MTGSQSLERGVEALLFASDAPATPAHLAEVLGCPIYAVEEALERLGGRLYHGSGIQLVRIAGGYQLCTKPEFAEAVAKFLKPSRTRMTRSQLEILAIVAYGQPVTVAEIDSVRGVDSSHTVRTLVDRRLIAVVGRKSMPGRPSLYGTTQQFLHQFNLDDLGQLPEVEKSLPTRLGHDVPPDQPALM